MHSIGVYHLDIHPGNIVLGRTKHEVENGKAPYGEDEVFIINFWSSRLAEGGKSQVCRCDVRARICYGAGDRIRYTSPGHITTTNIYRP